MAGILHRRVDGSVAHLVLARPDARNALNAALIAELRSAFEELGADSAVRAIVLSGEGKVFCAGADASWMRDSINLSHGQNVEDARRLAEMYAAIDRCPKPVIGRIHGAALGGGAGLVAVCDIAVCADDAIFGFTEVKLGIIPAVISPFVLPKIGSSHARALFLTGERFDAKRALRIGLVHESVVADTLDVAIERILLEIDSAGPQAIAAAKALIARVRNVSADDAGDMTIEATAERRTSEEGQEGLRSFLERRKPSWNS